MMYKVFCKRRICGLLIALLVLSLLTACSTQQAEPVDDAQQNNDEFHIVKDALDREVQVPNNPERVLALNASMTETLFNLGVVPVGLVNEYMIQRPEAEGLPDISLENSPNIEIINKLKPDLIIAHVRNHGQMLESLEGTGAAVVYIDPSSADDQLLGPVSTIGEVLNRQKEADAYIKEVEEKAKTLRDKIKESPVKTALFIQGGSQNISSARSFCFWGRLLDYLGLENIVPDEMAGSSKAGFMPFDIETIIQKDPDIIFVLQPGFRSGKGQGGGKGQGNSEGQKGNNIQEEESKQAAESKEDSKKQKSNTTPDKKNKIKPDDLKAMYEKDPMWQKLSAVKNGRLIIVPENIAPGKIKIIDALDVMARLTYPEAF